MANGNLEKGDLRILKSLLKRIDPSLRSKKASSDEKDERESLPEIQDNPMEFGGLDC